MKKILLFSFALGLGLTAFGQAMPQFTFHMFDQQVYNPAFVGSNGNVGLQVAGRQQWVGYEGAPNSYFVSVDAPLGKKSSLPPIAIGFVALRDEIGIRETNRFQGQIAYRIPFGNSTVLSFGLQGSLGYVMDDYRTIQAADPNDPLLGNIDRSGVIPNTGFGVYYYSNKFYLGASINDFVRDTYKNAEFVDPPSGINFQAGYRFDLSDDWSLRPTAMVRYTGYLTGMNADIVGDISVSGIYQDKLVVGLNHRTFESIGALVKYRFSKNLYAGYAYDVNIGSHLNQSNGSHEIMAGYAFDLNPKGISSPRFITYF